MTYIVAEPSVEIKDYSIILEQASVLVIKSVEMNGLHISKYLTLKYIGEQLKKRIAEENERKRVKNKTEFSKLEIILRTNGIKPVSKNNTQPENKYSQKTIAEKPKASEIMKSLINKPKGEIQIKNQNLSPQEFVIKKTNKYKEKAAQEIDRIIADTQIDVKDYSFNDLVNNFNKDTARQYQISLTKALVKGFNRNNNHTYKSTFLELLKEITPQYDGVARQGIEEALGYIEDEYNRNKGTERFVPNKINPNSENVAKDSIAVTQIRKDLLNGYKSIVQRKSADLKEYVTKIDEICKEQKYGLPVRMGAHEAKSAIDEEREEKLRLKIEYANPANSRSILYQQMTKPQTLFGRLKNVVSKIANYEICSWL